MNKSVSLSALVIAASVSTNTFAQGSGTTQTTQLEPIIVSAGISPVAADEYGRSHTVITRDDIEERGYATVQEALEAQPGLAVTGTGPNDRQVRIRGGETNHTLILVDGVRLAAGDGGFSGYSLRGLSLDYVERVEILRGPQSVPYGTDASTGVINIVTRQAKEGWNRGFSAELGEGDRESGYLSWGGAANRFSVSATNYKDDGFDVSGDGGERDSTRYQSLAFKGAFDLTGRTELGMTYRVADTYYKYDEDDAYSAGFSAGADDVDAYVFDSKAKEDNRLERLGKIYLENQSARGLFTHRLRFDRTSNQASDTSDVTTEVVSYRFRAALDESPVGESKSEASWLLERRVDEDAGQDDDRESDSIAAEYQGWLTDALSVQAGARYDDNSLFEDATTWNVSGSYFLTQGYRLHASVGKAVINPSFFEFGGNSELEPEKNSGFDVGFELPLRLVNGTFDITYFEETLTDEIAFDSSAGKSENQSGDSDRQGLELTASIAPFQALSVEGSYTYLDASEPDGGIEVRRPRNELGVTATWHLPDSATSFTGNLRYVRGLFDNENWKEGYPVVRLPSFTVVDLSATHTVTETVELTARITNALDEAYQEVLGYATRGRAGFVGVRASW
jgi:vitamin B12 transporter